MASRYAPSLPSFPLAFIAAPFAGAAAATLIPAVGIIAARDSASEFMAMVLFFGGFALAIATAFTIVTGLCVVVYVRRGNATPALSTAISVGVTLAVVAFGVVPLVVGGAFSDAALLALYATTAAIADAFTFWWLGLRGRAAVTRRA